jgi:hypothetical protein
MHDLPITASGSWADHLTLLLAVQLGGDWSGRDPWVSHMLLNARRGFGE